jgi:hypothetical protein
VTTLTGSAIQLPASGKVFVEVGYRGTDDEASGAGEIGFYFSEQRPAQVGSPLQISAPPVMVAAGKTRERVRTEMTIKAATAVTALWPNPGEGATSVEVSAMRPDGVAEPLLWLNNYRPDWPSSYVFKEPVSLPAGTRLIVTTFYDNAGTAPLKAQPSLSVTTTTVPSRPAASPGR